tara:strand:+ start:660 stop:791 length:132 start_codon:yes stop_codon:yes gene_type:complete
MEIKDKYDQLEDSLYGDENLYTNKDEQIKDMWDKYKKEVNKKK